MNAVGNWKLFYLIRVNCADLLGTLCGLYFVFES